MELELVYNEETQEWEQKPEPFITIECETEEDFEFIGTAVAFYKKHLEEQEKPQTNANRIRAMSDKELEWTIDPAIVPPGMTKREWLRQPAEEG